MEKIAFLLLPAVGSHVLGLRLSGELAQGEWRIVSEEEKATLFGKD